MIASIVTVRRQGTTGSHFNGARLGLLFTCATFVAISGFGQQSSPAKPASTEEIIELPAFTVGATLRSEPLLTVPIAVAVVTGDQMLQANLQGLSDISGTMPSLTFRSGGSNKDTSLLIRGVGTITTSPGTEPDVSTVVDGVVLARPGQATMDLTDIDHIEVLRGPQGTLFGKNSSVGVINVVSKDPSEKTTGYIDAAYFGGGNQETIHAGVSGAIVPNKLRASLSLLYDNYDGNVKNIFLNNTVNGHENRGVRTKFIFTPTSDFKATIIANYIKSFATTPNDGPLLVATNAAFPSGVTTAANPAVVAAIQPVVASANNLTINSGLWGRVTDYNDGVSAQLEWTMGAYKLTSISAYQNWYNNQFEDTGIIPQSIVGQTVSWDDGHLWFDQYSQELRVTSPTGRLFDFVSGLYFQRAIDTETYHRDIIQQPTAGNLVKNYGEAHYGTHGDNYSVYGEGTWNFSSNFRGITGLRLTHDTLNFYHQRIASSPVAVPGIQPTLPIHSGDTSANGVSGRAGLQYDVSKDVMVYATYSKGYKGPAYNAFFNQTALQVAALLPETSDSYEVGVKSLTFHNRLQVTATAFDTTYHNYQANFQTLVVGTSVTNLINAGQVSSKGVELEALARVTSQLTLSASVARINAVVDSFNTPPGAVNINGQPLPFAPRFKTNIEANYRIPLSEGLRIDVSTNYAWQSKQQFSLTQTPDTIQGNFGIWNTSIALSKPSDGWRVSLLVKNITDTHYSTLLSQAGGFVWRVAPRDTNRYFGIIVHKDFY